jgi:hypothetical protein
VRRSRRTLLASLALLAAACGGGLKTVAKDGYTGILSFSKEERFQVAVRGEWKRVEGLVDGGALVRIVRPDRKKAWEFRPDKKAIREMPWGPTDEVVPGYPLEPGFDPQAYADRFGAAVERIGDETHGLHPCDRWRLTLPSGDLVTLWAARDLDRLVVKIEHLKKDQGDEYQPFTTTEMLDVRVGADPGLFEPPKGYRDVKTYEELTKP